MDVFYTFQRVCHSHFIAKAPEFDLSCHSEGDSASSKANRFALENKSTLFPKP